MTVRPLHDRAVAGEWLFGGLLRPPAGPLVEAAARAGLDFVVFDLGGPELPAVLRAHVATARALGLAVVVRAADQDRDGRLRDLDVDGVLVDRGGETVMLPVASAGAAEPRPPGPDDDPPAGVRVALADGPAAARRHLASGTRTVLYELHRAVDRVFGELAAARGTGPRPEPEPLVVLSGMLGDASAWQDVAAALGDGVDVRHQRIDLGDSVADLAANVLAAAPDRFALAGHSLGGIVALEAVRQDPRRVTRLALLNTSAGAGTAVQLRAWAATAERIERGGFAAVVAESARSNLPAHRRQDAALVARIAHMARTVGPDGLLRQLQAQTTRPDSHPHLPGIAVPTLVLSGELDEISPPGLQAELAAHIPHAVHDVIAGCGHMSPLECPDAVAGRLRAWLGA